MILESYRSFRRSQLRSYRMPSPCCVLLTAHLFADCGILNKKPANAGDSNKAQGEAERCVLGGTLGIGEELGSPRSGRPTKLEQSGRTQIQVPCFKGLSDYTRNSTIVTPVPPSFCGAA